VSEKAGESKTDLYPPLRRSLGRLRGQITPIAMRMIGTKNQSSDGWSSVARRLPSPDARYSWGDAGFRALS
jgi:hypothetical protein